MPTPRRIPKNELRVTFARSSGAGGQNVNKTSTKAVVHWPVASSRALAAHEKDLLNKKLAGRITKTGELIVAAQDERSQARNRARAAERLEALIGGALKPKKRRLATRPSRAAAARRLQYKKHHSRLKATRRGYTD